MRISWINCVLMSSTSMQSSTKKKCGGEGKWEGMCHNSARITVSFIKQHLACWKQNRKKKAESISHICTEHGMNRWNDTVSVISRYGVPKLLQKKKKYHMYTSSTYVTIHTSWQPVCSSRCWDKLDWNPLDISTQPRTCTARMPQGFCFPDLEASCTGCRINRPAPRNKSPARTTMLAVVTPSGLRGVQGFHKSWPAQDTAINRGILTQSHWAHVTSKTQL